MEILARLIHLTLKVVVVIRQARVPSASMASVLPVFQLTSKFTKDRLMGRKMMKNWRHDSRLKMSGSAIMENQKFTRLMNTTMYMDSQAASNRKNQSKRQQPLLIRLRTDSRNRAHELKI